MASGDALGNAVSGLLAFQRGLATTSHNISNVNTAGYSRQRVEFATRTPTQLGNGFIGNGVQTTAVARVYDGFLTQQVQSNTSSQTQFATFHDFAARVDNLLGDPEAGLMPGLQQFFAALQGVANDPSSLPARQVLLSEAEALAGRFHYLEQGLDDLERNVNDLVANAVTEVNEYAKAIADVNHKIVLAGGQGAGQAPSDLLDQRDELVRKLSELLSVSTYQQDDGSLNVFVGNGQSLVLGGQAQTLSRIGNEFDATRYEIGYRVGTSTVNVTNQLVGGKLGGVLAFRAEVLDSAHNALGRIALAVSAQVNAQHALGQDLSGNLGGDFFAALDSASPQAVASALNTGTGAIGVAVSNPGVLKPSDYALAYVGGNYTVTRLSDNATVYSGAAFPATLASEGLTLSLGGAPAAGDRFLIRPTRAAAADFAVAVTDPRSVAAAAPIRTAATVGNAGTGQVGAGVVNALDPNLQQTVTITFNNPPTTFNVVGTGTGNPVNVPYTAGGDISYNGWTVQIGGAPAAGDSFTVEANVNGVGDNRNALGLGALQSQLNLDGGTATYTDAYGALIADVATRTRTAEINNNVQSSLLAQSVAARDSVSGVNLDEEAANMLRFQQAYQAAAQMIGVADSLFQTLIVSLRG